MKKYLLAYINGKSRPDLTDTFYLEVISKSKTDYYLKSLCEIDIAHLDDAVYGIVGYISEELDDVCCVVLIATPFSEGSHVVYYMDKTGTHHFLQYVKYRESGHFVPMVAGGVEAHLLEQLKEYGLSKGLDYVEAIA